MVRHVIEEHSVFGKCLQISNGCVSVYVTLEFGPRVIFYGMGENMLYEDCGRSFSFGGEAFDQQYYPGARWYIYGGHRLCVAPETVPGTYYPDNEPVTYSTDGTHFQFTTQEPENGLEKSLRLLVNDSGSEVRLYHQVKNISDRCMTLAIWPVTAMTPGGTAYAAFGKDCESPGTPNRGLCFWPATNVRDERLDIGNKLITLRHDPSAQDAVKLGLISQDGVCCYFAKGCLFKKKAVYSEGSHVVDMGANLELYSGSHCLEMESLSPTYCLKPGETGSHTEIWALERSAGCDEAMIIDILTRIKG